EKKEFKSEKQHAKQPKAEKKFDKGSKKNAKKEAASAAVKPEQPKPAAVQKEASEANEAAPKAEINTEKALADASVFLKEVFATMNLEVEIENPEEIGLQMNFKLTRLKSVGFRGR
ncbi:MAG: hypothetical protein LIO44_04560, partial [Eubacterium sp.]|nr:hypothetical protein [Eubacterium sp.]